MLFPSSTAGVMHTMYSWTRSNCDSESCQRGSGLCSARGRRGGETYQSHKLPCDRPDLGEEIGHMLRRADDYLRTAPSGQIGLSMLIRSGRHTVPAQRTVALSGGRDRAVSRRRPFVRIRPGRRLRGALILPATVVTGMEDASRVLVGSTHQVRERNDLLWQTGLYRLNGAVYDL